MVVSMDKERQLEHSLVQIDGREDEGVFFVIDYVEGLKGRTANLKLTAPRTRIIRDIPVESLKFVQPASREPLDYFAKIVVQGLRMRNGEIISPVFYCDTIFKEFQFRPLLKYVRSPNKRLLIADETGLGKTIEAGYIIISELSENIAKRIVILCPPNIRHKWRIELWRRFGLSFDIVSGRGLRKLLSSKGGFHCIASIDCFRPFEDVGLYDLLRSVIDLLIIDEAHHMIGRSGETLRRRLGLSLSSISKAVIGLTATPIHLELLDLKRLLDVISPGFKTNDEFEREMNINVHLNRLYRVLTKNPWNSGDFGHFLEEADMLRDSLSESGNADRLAETMKENSETLMHDVKARYELRKSVREKNTLSELFTRTRKVEVGEKRTRVIRNERIMLDSETFEAVQEGRMVKASEKSLFHEIDEFLRTSFYGPHRRQLSSCLNAMIDLMRRGMKGFNVWVDDELRELDVRLNEGEKNKCRELANKFGLLRKDSKWNRLIEIVTNLRCGGLVRKVIVFTEWIPTINYFRRMKGYVGCPCYVISGMDGEETRLATMKSFQDHEGFTVLFTTDVMSEGLDLQNADCIVNYDLPYNPQKVEQRIGRIDRIGQKENRIVVINMLVVGSTDELVYDRLLERIGVFKEAIGDLPEILLEEAEKIGIIDDEQVIRVLKDYEVQSRLLNSDLLIGIDDILDQDIRAEYSKKGWGAYSLRWMAFERFMYLIIGEEKAKRTTVDEDGITFRGLEPLDLETLVDLVHIKDKEAVQMELLNAVSLDGTLRIAFNKDANGLFLPCLHPLMQKASDVAYQSFYRDNCLDVIETERIVLRGELKEIWKEVKILLLAEFRFEGETIHRRDWFWFALNKDNTMTKMSTSPLEEVWQAHLDRRISAELLTGDLELLEIIKFELLKNLEGWDSELRNKDLAETVRLKKFEARLLSQRLIELKDALKSEANPSRTNDINMRIIELEKKFEDSKSKVKELEADSTCSYKEPPFNYRIVVVLSLERKDQ
jgi:superfamily II DNA or RNA helicase